MPLWRRHGERCSRQLSIGVDGGKTRTVRDLRIDRLILLVEMFKKISRRVSRSIFRAAFLGSLSRWTENENFSFGIRTASEIRTEISNFRGKYLWDFFLSNTSNSWINLSNKRIKESLLFGRYLVVTWIKRHWLVRDSCRMTKRDNISLLRRTMWIFSRRMARTGRTGRIVTSVERRLLPQRGNIDRWTSMGRTLADDSPLIKADYLFESTNTRPLVPHLEYPVCGASERLPLLRERGIRL